MEHKLLPKTPKIDDHQSLITEWSSDADFISREHFLHADHAVELIFIFFCAVGAILQVTTLDNRVTPQFKESIQTFLIITYLVTLTCMLSTCYLLLFPRPLASLSLWNTWVVRTKVKTHKRRFVMETVFFSIWGALFFSPLERFWLLIPILASLTLRLCTWYLYLKYYFLRDSAGDKGEILLLFLFITIISMIAALIVYFLAIPIFTFVTIVLLFLLCGLCVFIYFFRPIWKVSIIAWLAVVWFFVNLTIPRFSGLESFAGTNKDYIFPTVAHFDNGNYSFNGHYLSIVDSADWYNDELTLHRKEYPLLVNKNLLSINTGISSYSQLQDAAQQAQRSNLLALITNDIDLGLVVDDTITIPVMTLNNSKIPFLYNGWWSCYRDDILVIDKRPWSYFYLLAPVLFLSLIYIILQVRFLYENCIMNSD